MGVPSRPQVPCRQPNKTAPFQAGAALSLTFGTTAVVPGSHDLRATPRPRVPPGASGGTWLPHPARGDRGPGRRPSRASGRVTRTARGRCRCRSPARRRRARTGRTATPGRVIEAGALVRDGRPQAREAPASAPISTWTVALAVLDRVVEQRPEDLVELVAVGDGQPVRGLVVEVERPVGHAERVPGAAGPAARWRATSAIGRGGCDSSRLTRSELLDHPRQAIGLFRDDRQPRVRGRSPRRASAFDRIDVSGVCRLWLTPRRKSSLISLRCRSWTFCSWTWLNSSALRMATPISLANRSSSVWSARSHVWVAGRLAQEQADPLVAGAQLRADRDRDAGDPLLGLDAVRIDEPERRGDEPEGAFGIARRAFGHGVDAVARLGGFDRRQDEPELRLRRCASSARRLWLSASWARTSSPSTGIGWLTSPAETRATASEISRSGATRSRPTAAPPSTPTADGDREHEQQEPASRPGARRRRSRSAAAPKIAERDDRRGQQRQGQPGLEREPRTAVRRAARVAGSRRRCRPRSTAVAATADGTSR